LIGRFQPFHNGHLEVVRRVAVESERVIVGIGSAQLSHTYENPFTAGERHLMISRALADEGLERFFLVPIPDINRYAVWVSHVSSLVPPFDIVYTNNPLTRRLFEEAGYEVKGAPLFDRGRHSGTEVRRRMLSGEDWESLLHPRVAETVREVGGLERLREISRKEA